LTCAFCSKCHVDAVEDGLQRLHQHLALDLCELLRPPAARQPGAKRCASSSLGFHLHVLAGLRVVLGRDPHLVDQGRPQALPTSAFSLGASPRSADCVTRRRSYHRGQRPVTPERPARSPLAATAWRHRRGSTPPPDCLFAALLRALEIALHCTAIAFVMRLPRLG
jgi:hypothetical protein